MRNIEDTHGPSVRDRPSTRKVVRAFNGGIITPEPLAGVTKPIGYVELYAYHGLAVEKAWQYANQHPDQTVFSVGLEFPDIGYTIQNHYRVNYDATEFLKLLPRDSIPIIDLSISLQHAVSLYREARRVLAPGGYLVTFDHVNPPLWPGLLEKLQLEHNGVLEELVKAGFTKIEQCPPTEFDHQSQ